MPRLASGAHLLRREVESELAPLFDEVRHIGFVIHRDIDDAAVERVLEVMGRYFDAAASR